MTARRLTLLAALFALLIAASTAQGASIWTPVSSGTNGTITSIVYQSPTRFWYATSGGTIAFFNGSDFTAGTGITPGENVVDLAFQPGGSVGYAVTSNGHVWRSTNSGTSWNQLAARTTNADCGNPSSPGAETELNAVHWANSTTVYLLAQDFGRLYQSSNALSGVVSGTKTGNDTVNSYNGNPRLAQDAGNPNRLWVADHESGGGGCGTLCLEVSTDGANNWTNATFPNDSSVTGGLYDISSRGGVEVTAGSGGEIFNSVTGTDFFLNRAAGSLTTENWRAEDATTRHTPRWAGRAARSRSPPRPIRPGPCRRRPHRARAARRSAPAGPRSRSSRSCSSPDATRTTCRSTSRRRAGAG
ncbi:MAG: WD40/YVTN/BNR-like repeat-containing protein [Solirubrobacteraceae bacterium]